jgi:U5 small nuclear ribonucleoprotein component
LETPIVNVEVQKNFDYVEKLNTKCHYEFFEGLMENQPSIRCICVAGHLHHGKSLLMDMLVQQAFVKDWNPERNYRWTDTRVD